MINGSCLWHLNTEEKSHRNSNDQAPRHLQSISGRSWPETAAFPVIDHTVPLCRDFEHRPVEIANVIIIHEQEIWRTTPVRCPTISLMQHYPKCVG